MRVGECGAKNEAIAGRHTMGFATSYAMFVGAGHKKFNRSQLKCTANPVSIVDRFRLVLAILVVVPSTLVIRAVGSTREHSSRTVNNRKVLRSDPFCF